MDSKPSVEAAALPASKITTSAVPSNAAGGGTASPAAADEPLPSSYVYDLKKLIIKSRENIKRVNAKIKEQAVIKRNQKREERAREYYERGLQLTDEGKLDEAREYFDKAIRITEHPEMTGYIKESERRLKQQEQAIKREEVQRVKQQQQDEHAKHEDADGVYRDAVALYKEKKFKAAKDQFDRVEELVPDYKAVRSYLRILDQDIIQEQERASKQQKVEIEHQNKEAEAARAREKEMWLKEIDRKEKERKDQINKQADANYNEAVQLYKTRKFTAAKAKFQEVEWVVPDYKAARNYLKNIDKDIAEEEKRAAVEKQKTLEKQQWEETVARKKEEVKQQQIAAEKEKEHRKQLEEQAQFVYQAALTLYDKRLWDEALEKFNDIEKTAPGYRSTRVYIAKIAQMKEEDKRRKAQEEVKEAKQKAMAGEKAKEEAAKQAKQKALGEEKNKHEEFLAKQRAELQEVKHRTQQAQRLYDEGVFLYRQKQLDAAKEKFIGVARFFSDFKDTKSYLARLKVDMSVAAAAPSLSQRPSVEVPKPARPAVLSKEGEVKEAKAIAELAEKSAALYKQISGMSEDRYTTNAKHKLFQVENVLNNLKQQKERILRQAREEEQRARQEELKRQQEMRKAQAAQMYDEAIMLLRNRDFDGAKVKFLELENTLPDFKATRSYLSRIDQDKEKAGQEAVLERTRAEETRLKELQEKQRREEAAARAAEEERRRQLRQAREMEVRNLAEKAGILNDDILKLSKEHDFEGVKSKFDELEKVVTSWKSTKEAMASDQEKAEQSRQKEALEAKEQARQRKLTQALESQKKIMEDQQKPEPALTPQERKERFERRRQGEERQKELAEHQKQKEEAAEAKTQRPSAQQQKVLEKKRREELRQKEMDRRRQEAERLERERQDKQKKIEDDRRKAGLDAQARQRQKELEAERVAIRKQLEDGVEPMYEDAMGLYKQGKYNEAARKFHDLQDIIPDYKQSRDFIRKSVFVAPQPPLNPVPRAMSRNKAVAKALDSLEPNGR